ncbi:MAG TPA: hypothetical protein VMG12_34810 [Polyangiaceae bacterium]|nr:hypothetical protein [Polyangiaceae bacterium]
MSDPSRDARWSEAEPELPSELAELLGAARAELGSADEVSELARRLSVALGPAAGLAGDGSPGPDGSGRGAPGSAASNTGSPDAASTAGRAPGAPAPSGASHGAWVFGGIVGGVAIAITAYVLGGVPSGPGAPDAASVPTEPVAAASAPTSMPEPAQTAEPEQVAPAQTAEPAPPAAPTSSLPPSDTGPGSAPASSGPGSRTTHPPAGRARARAQMPDPAADGLAEIALLEQAQGVLKSHPAEALAYTRRHQARFPNGALAQEREVIAIEALERLGRNDDARARAAEFERRYRGSVHQPRLQRSTDTSAPAGGALNTAPP